MMIPNAFADCHIHSTYSYDGKSSIEDSCRAAFSAGLSTITFVDHCDMREHRNGYRCYFPVVDARQKDIEFAANNWRGRLAVLNGIELGDVSNNPNLARQHLEEYAYDFILGSVHHQRDVSQLDLNMLSAEEKLEIYFGEIEALLDFGEFDSLAHLDYPVRYWRVPYETFPLFRDRIHYILTRVAADGHALEINTSGARKEGGYIGPQNWILADFRTVGGKYITLGSDAHNADEVGSYFGEAVKMAQRAGFDAITYYKARKPVTIHI